MRMTTYDDVRAALTTPALAVPPVPGGARAGTVEWLRSHVARFSSGKAHHRRRTIVTHVLAGLEPDMLRQKAAELARSILDESEGRSIDLMAEVARVVPVRVLAKALGIRADVVNDVATVAPAYHAQAEPDATIDSAVGRLVSASGGVADELTANRIGLLVQAVDATAGLVGNAVVALTSHSPTAPVGSVITEVLRSDPPVRSTRRLATAPTRNGAAEISAGTIVELSLTTTTPEHHLAFGAGPHECPGQAIAIALTGGILSAARRCRLVSAEISYLPSPNLRVPAAVVVSAG